MSRLLKKIRGTVHSVRMAAWVWTTNRRLARAPRDSRVQYPSYKSLDHHIDVERLKSLDGYLKEKIEAFAQGTGSEAFDTGNFKLRPWAPKKPGSRVVDLSVSKREFRYFDLCDPDLWQPAKHANEFSLLMDFIEGLPFKRRSRMIIMFDYGGHSVPAHRDHQRIDVCNEFIWFRSNLDKNLFMMDRKTGRKKNVESYSAWFDSVNQYHGSEGTPGLAFSIRVDGIFSDKLRAKIPIPACNPASTASLWDALEG